MPPSPREYPPPTENELKTKKYDFEDKEEVDESMFRDEDEDSGDDEFYEEYRRVEMAKMFLKQLRDSRGYDVECYPPLCLDSPFAPRPFSIDEELHEEAKEQSKSAVAKINDEMAVAENSDNSDAAAPAPMRTFQAMVYKPLHGDLELVEWRFKPVPVSSTGA
ncbi:OLC1v1031883C1 [Oldenlandia corymbosa var. corymbosa]|uniref:OLC1v1031883C1 n=1 Tax=Oldenlandia corymbosa var. corymbosa TaxID=529605 RepID=A0AAV1CKB7_OLDCO|nr:OLC1v1031883C1 [Oldenlandia corymbosa var. corymbosa]